MYRGKVYLALGWRLMLVGRGGDAVQGIRPYLSIRGKDFFPFLGNAFVRSPTLTP